METGRASPPTQLVRHQLAALAYRFQKAIGGAPASFASFEAGEGVRSPLAIVHHMNGVLGYLRGVLSGADVGFVHAHPQLDWPGEVGALHAMLADLDALLADRRTVPVKDLERALQGPLADTMTHVGQLAMLRRLAGSPVRGENFYLADVHVGRVGPDQAAPRSPDP